MIFIFEEIIFVIGVFASFGLVLGLFAGFILDI